MLCLTRLGCIPVMAMTPRWEQSEHLSNLGKLEVGNENLDFALRLFIR